MLIQLAEATPIDMMAPISDGQTGQRGAGHEQGDDDAAAVPRAMGTPDLSILKAKLHRSSVSRPREVPHGGVHPGRY